jgi:hypothetical protein
VADLHKQHRQAEEDKQSPCPSRDAAFRPGQLWFPTWRAMRSHDLSRYRL